MSKRLYIVLFFIISFFFSGNHYVEGESFSAPFIRAASRARPSVVNITVYREKKGGGDALVKVAEGAGVILNRWGIVVTNHHVLEKGTVYSLSYYDGTPCETGNFDNGQSVMNDPKTDIALLRIRNYHIGKYPPMAMGDSTRLSEGEWVIAIGNPYGLRQSISCGVVSFKGRDNIGFTDIEDFIQTDVSINPGNSGGPLVNLQGEMVGINTAIRTVSGGFQGISFSIPTVIVRRVSDELLNFGRVRRGWLGFVARDARRDRSSESVSVEILRVVRNSPAEDAGLRGGDVIREIDGVSISSVSALVREVGNRPIGSRTHIMISRDGKFCRVSLVLRERGTYRAIQTSVNGFLSRYGVELDENAEDRNIVISSLSPRSAGSGLRQGDILNGVNGRRVQSLEDFAALYNKNGGEIETLQILRDGDLYEISLDGERGR